MLVYVHMMYYEIRPVSGTYMVTEVYSLQQYIETPHRTAPCHRTALVIGFSVGLQAWRFVLNYGQY